MDVYWAEQTQADLPARIDWLSERELATLSGLRFAKRRADWLLGRWTAKRALASYLSVPGDACALTAIELRPAPSGAPQAFLAGQPAAASISLSHRSGAAVCAVAAPGIALGCDLELIEPRTDGFIADYFTTEEQRAVAGAITEDRFCLVALLWSAKESTLKALGVGLRYDTQSVVVTPLQAFDGRDDEGENWRPLNARFADRPLFHGWWQQTGEFVKTLVASPPPSAPSGIYR